MLAWLLACTTTLEAEDTVSQEGLSWYASCGDPACSTYAGPWEGVPLCADEGVALGDSCPDPDASCDPVDACNALWVCTAEDPHDQEGGCPI